MINNNIEYIKMNNVEQNHWWYQNLHNITLYFINKYFHNNKSIQILDAGCGTGGLMEKLRINHFHNIYGFDLSDFAVEICKEKKLNVQKGNLKNFFDLYSKNKFDVIISHDNFYFLNEKEWKNKTRNFYDILKNNGIILMNLPALSMFSGIHDKAVGINYRFNKKDIYRIFDRIQFKCSKSIYWPFLLSPFILLIRFMQRQQLKKNPDYEIKSDVYLPQLILNYIFNIITKFETFFLPFKPFGSSLFLVMEKNVNKKI